MHDYWRLGRNTTLCTGLVAVKGECAAASLWVLCSEEATCILPDKLLLALLPMAENTASGRYLLPSYSSLGSSKPLSPCLLACGCICIDVKDCTLSHVLHFHATAWKTHSIMCIHKYQNMLMVNLCLLSIKITTILA